MVFGFSLNFASMFDDFFVLFLDATTDDPLCETLSIVVNDGIDFLINDAIASLL